MRGTPLRYPYRYTNKRNKTVSGLMMLTNILYEEKDYGK
jgi:hypothetical protein